MADHAALLDTLTKVLQAATRGERLLRLPEVEERTGLTSSTIYRMLDEHTFPLPRRASTRIIGWLESDIDTWLRGLPTTTEAPLAVPPPIGRPKVTPVRQ
jgi:prophage regulatory protein